jgi:DNA replication and repair protein RecF
LNYRNFERCLFHPDQGINFLTGANAQGKTNLLEAVLMVLTGRPMRGAQESYLVNGHAASGGLKTEIHRGGVDDVVEVRLTREDRKIRINGREAGSGQLPGPAAVSLFTPADLSLVQGSPQERRRFIDLELSALDRSYAGIWRRYQRALWQKNKAVLAQRARGPDTEVWDEQLALYGSKIMILRNLWLASFGREAGELYREISGDGTLAVELTASCAGGQGLEEKEVLESLREALGSGRDDQGPAAVGPHRDDLVLGVGGMNARYSSSQGEQRTVALCLRLAGHGLRRRELGEDPLLLLDDAFYELDQRRRERLMGVIAGAGQVLATSVSAPGTGIGRVFNIEGGSISG